MLIRTVSVALLLTVACDPGEGGATPQTGKTPVVAATAPPTPDPAASPLAESARPQAVGEAAGRDERAAYSSCLRGCDDAKVAHADKATCRFNCEQPSPSPTGAAATAVDADPVETVVRCMSGCYGDGKRSEPCSSACTHAVAGLPATPSAQVLASLGTCLDACHVDRHISETDRATCELNCSQAARVAGPAPATSVKARP